MNKVCKRIFSILLAFFLILGESNTYSYARENINIKVKQQPKVDIVLTTQDTTFDLSNFKNDLKAYLEKEHMSNVDINFQLADNSYIDTSNADASQIFNSWTQFPQGNNNGWYYDTNNKRIVCPSDSPSETGFFDSKNFVSDFTMESTLYAPELNQPVGFVYRITQDPITKRYSMYWLWVSGDRFINGYLERVIAIFKTDGYDNNALTRIGTNGYIAPNGNNEWLNYSYNNNVIGGCYAATPQERCGLNEWTNHRPGGYPQHVSTAPGSIAINTADPQMKTTTIASYSLNTINYYNTGYSWAIPYDYNPYNLKLVANGNNFKVYYNNNLVIDANDTYGQPLYNGYLGLFTFSHPNAGFSYINVDAKNTRIIKKHCHNQHGEKMQNIMQSI